MLCSVFVVAFLLSVLLAKTAFCFVGRKFGTRGTLTRGTQSLSEEGGTYVTCVVHESGSRQPFSEQRVPVLYLYIISLQKKTVCLCLFVVLKFNPNV